MVEQLEGGGFFIAILFITAPWQATGRHINNIQYYLYIVNQIKLLLAERTDSFLPSICHRMLRFAVRSAPFRRVVGHRPAARWVSSSESHVAAIGADVCVYTIL